ncbi:MAG: hypothetical protein Q9191_004840 [Dirinaria sp. TL-2023a]
MSGNEEFTLVSTSSDHRLYDDYEDITSGKLASLHTSLLAALRREYPDLCVTVTLAGNVNLLAFAALGHAVAELDTKTDGVQRLRYFLSGNDRRDIPDQLAEARSFAKYHYRWGREHFIVYIITEGFNTFNYILKEPAEGESTLSQPSVTDALINAVGKALKPDDRYIYVYDGYWSASRQLWDEVQKARWDDVILDEDMKKTLVDLMRKFFDSKDIYDDLGVPWKRGVIFHGPAGNGKTISIKALMHSLSAEREAPIPCLYVKSAPRTYDIGNIFALARSYSPCMLILEDIDTIVTLGSRSYFFNEVDGLQNNDGIFIVASTNHLDQLDPGLSSRPSRFDRKYLFPLPSSEERVLYCQYWRKKLKNKPAIKFPRKLCPAIAGITQEFSFAYLKEAFVATLLTIARRRSDFIACGGGDDDNDSDLDDYELWREMKKTVKALREDMGTRNKRTVSGYVLGANGVPTPQFQSLASSIPPSPGYDASASSATPMHELALRGRAERYPPASFEYQHAGTPSDHSWSASPLISDNGQILDRNALGLGWSMAPT